MVSPSGQGQRLTGQTHASTAQYANAAPVTFVAFSTMRETVKLSEAVAIYLRLKGHAQVPVGPRYVEALGDGAECCNRQITAHRSHHVPPLRQLILRHVWYINLICSLRHEEVRSASIKQSKGSEFRNLWPPPIKM